ncbi:MAG: hydratase [Burkholderiales bacterium]
MIQPETLLSHNDQGTLWPADRAAPQGDVASAYQAQLAVRALRIARGEAPRGFKIGFTNRTIWERYNVRAPIWGTVWRETLQFCDGEGKVDLTGLCQPRLEPECVFGIAKTPPVGANLDQLFDCIDWFAPGFEIVQSHCADWKFDARESVADGGLHARLLVGKKKPVHEVAADAAELESALACTPVSLYRGNDLVDGGIGANVLDGPLHALHYFLNELRTCPGAPGLELGDVVTTGTWTDAWPVEPGQRWRAEFEAPLARLDVAFK